MSEVAKRIASLSPERRALLARLQASGATPPVAEPLAIVGIGCRFPGGGDSPEAFWRVIRDGIDAVGEVPSDRWDADAFFDPDPAARGKMVTRWGGFLSDIDRFDPYFFGISPRETASLDPQQRVLLEVCWEALQDAGLTQERLAASRTGVYVGTHTMDHAWMLFADVEGLDAYASTGTAHSIVANRVSYVFDLHGPSVAVDTACSSSLVAVHLAAQALRQRECDLALAGGVNLLLSPLWAIALSKLGMLSPDGRCKTFDAGANGIVRGEGCGIVALKRLADALADGDHVWALVRGSATNQDGRTNGLTAPNGLAQRAVIREALANAGVAPGEVTHVETHGTGTVLGDPIEVEALAEVLGTGPPCALGSVKTNIGHLEGAAGIAGLIKAVLSLHHEVVPAPVHFKELNPHLVLEGSRLLVPKTPWPWPRGEQRRIAGVSAFGFGGTNAHVVLEEPPLREPAASADGDGRAHLLPLSARSATGLRTLTRAYADRLGDPAGAALPDVAYSAAVRRSHHPYRLAVVGRTREEVAARLSRAAEDESLTTSREPAPPGGLVFVFSGQGSQWSGMGRELTEREPAYRAALDECDALVRAEAGWSVREALADESPDRLRDTEVAQPAIFAMQVALATLLRSWGIEPDAVTGHSMGEVAAAHVAGALDLRSAVRIVVHRARLMQRATGHGLMAAVELTEEEARSAIAEHRDLAIAAVNAPRSTVLTGAPAALAEVLAGLAKRGVVCRALPVNYAFHSPQMEPLRDELVRALVGLAVERARIPVLSTVSGALAEVTDFGAEYWGRNIRETVQFARAVDGLGRAGHRHFVELGPHPVLGQPIQQCLEAMGLPGTAFASLRRGQPGDTALLGLVGALYEGGRTIDWNRLHPRRGRSVRVPLTPWERASFPARTGAGVAAHPTRPAGGAAVHPLLGRRLATAVPVFEANLAADRPAYLGEHRIGGATLLPAAAVVEMALAAARELCGAGPHVVGSLVIREPLALPSEGGRSVQTVCRPEGTVAASLELFAGGSAGAPPTWTPHATCRVESIPALEAAESLDLNALRARCPEAIEGDAHYARLAGGGADFGPAFRTVVRAQRGRDEALVTVDIPAALDTSGYRVHPALLDGCLQAVTVALPADAPLLLPVAIDRIEVHGQPGRRVLAHSVLREPAGGADGCRADVTILDETGVVVARMTGVYARPRPSGSARAGAPQLYEVQWRRQPLTVAAVVPTPGVWVVVTTGGETGETLRRALEARGQRCATATPDTASACLAAEARECRGVIYLDGLDTAPPTAITGAALDVEVERVCHGALDLVHALAAAAPAAPRLWLVTRRLHVVDADGAPASPVHAPLWGLGAVLALEQPQLRCTRVDVDGSPACVDALAREVLADGAEDQVALRGAARYVARLERAAPPVADRLGTPLRLDTSARGILDNLAWVPARRRAPMPGEVEIRVHATGLNFRDVLNALGLYPGDAGALGSECAGEIVAVGAGVDFHVGDAVIAVADGAFGSFVTTPAALVARKPERLTMPEAATTPIAFLTASHALLDLAGLRKGERVLIHAAAGGVGLAAVRVALNAGAEVFATAGSPDKRAHLAALGVQHIMDSRSLAFGAEVLARTEGTGVDVVLNSLTGEFIPASLGVLARRGRFVEIGKRGIWDDAQVAAVRPDVAYHVLYLGEVCQRAPALIQARLRALVEDLESGALAPLPMRVFAAGDAADAFRFMAQARHTGKIVVGAPTAVAIRSDATYLVTGGLGALGLDVARWLAARGAGCIVLMGRTAPSAQAAEAIATLEREGVRVVVAAGDVAVDADVERLVGDIAAGLPPLRGVVHAAGVVEDGMLQAQTWPGFARVLAPKVRGAWNLHVATRRQALDFFLLFSSMASVLGSPGQGSYAAANAFLDALAHWRRQHGLPALSVNWGPWAGAGMAASLNEAQRRRWRARGVDAIQPADGRASLDDLLGLDRAQVSVLAIDWTTYRATHPAFAGAFLPAGAAPAGPTPPRGAKLVEEVQAAAPAQRPHIIAAHVRQEAIGVLGLEPGYRLDPRRGLKDLGLDSLMAVELRNRLERSLGRPLPTTLAFDHPTVEALAVFVERELLGDAAIAPAASTADAAAGVADLSEEDATALLMDELTRPRRSTDG